MTVSDALILQGLFLVLCSAVGAFVLPEVDYRRRRPWAAIIICSFVIGAASLISGIWMAVLL